MANPTPLSGFNASRHREGAPPPDLNVHEMDRLAEAWRRMRLQETNAALPPIADRYADPTRGARTIDTLTIPQRPPQGGWTAARDVLLVLGLIAVAGLAVLGFITLMRIITGV
jgi:hypothetical protein